MFSFFSEPLFLTRSVPFFKWIFGVYHWQTIWVATWDTIIKNLFNCIPFIAPICFILFRRKVPFNCSPKQIIHWKLWFLFFTLTPVFVHLFFIRFYMFWLVLMYLKNALQYYKIFSTESISPIQIPIPFSMTRSSCSFLVSKNYANTVTLDGKRLYFLMKFIIKVGNDSDHKNLPTITVTAVLNLKNWSNVNAGSNSGLPVLWKQKDSRFKIDYLNTFGKEPTGCSWRKTFFIFL